ncbi:MAG: hypothetical protein WC769_01635 [Thermodesulfovibrionales bacterium]|jgi:hypothetical protein
MPEPETQDIFAIDPESLFDSSEILKENGIRDIENIFLGVRETFKLFKQLGLTVGEVNRTISELGNFIR